MPPRKLRGGTCPQLTSVDDTLGVDCKYLHGKRYAQLLADILGDEQKVQGVFENARTKALLRSYLRKYSKYSELQALFTPSTDCSSRFSDFENDDYSFENSFLTTFNGCEDPGQFAFAYFKSLVQRINLKELNHEKHLGTIIKVLEHEEVGEHLAAYLQGHARKSTVLDDLRTKLIILSERRNEIDAELRVLNDFEDVLEEDSYKEYANLLYLDVKSAADSRTHQDKFNAALKTLQAQVKEVRDKLSDERGLKKGRVQVNVRIRSSGTPSAIQGITKGRLNEKTIIKLSGVVQGRKLREVNSTIGNKNLIQYLQDNTQVAYGGAQVRKDSARRGDYLPTSTDLGGVEYRSGAPSRHPPPVPQQSRTYLGRAQPPSQEYETLPRDGQLNAKMDAKPFEIEKQYPVSNFHNIFNDVSTPEVFDKEHARLCIEKQMDIVYFAYGFSGSGKTYTLLGDEEKHEKGVIHLFAENVKGMSEEYSINLVSIQEVYVETFDVKNPEPQTLSWYPDLQYHKPIASGLDSRKYTHPMQFIINELRSRITATDYDGDSIIQQSLKQYATLRTSLGTVFNAATLSSMLEHIKKLRQYCTYTVKFTPNNKESSRSHLVIRLNVMRGSEFICAATFVDMAGLENADYIKQNVFETADDVKNIPKRAWLQYRVNDIMPKSNSKTGGETEFSKPAVIHEKGKFKFNNLSEGTSQERKDELRKLNDVAAGKMFAYFSTVFNAGYNAFKDGFLVYLKHIYLKTLYETSLRIPLSAVIFTRAEGKDTNIQSVNQAIGLDRYDEMNAANREKFTVSIDKAFVYFMYMYLQKLFAESAFITQSINELVELLTARKTSRDKKDSADEFTKKMKGMFTSVISRTGIIPVLFNLQTVRDGLIDSNEVNNEKIKRVYDKTSFVMFCTVVNNSDNLVRSIAALRFAETVSSTSPNITSPESGEKPQTSQQKYTFTLSKVYKAEKS